MCRPVVVCSIFMILFRVQPTSTQSEKGTRVIARVSNNSDKSIMQGLEDHLPGHKLHVKLSDATNVFQSGRQKRSLFTFGRIATNFLLRGTRPVESNTFHQYYIKPGGYQNALKDFDSVNPNSVLQIGVVKTGEVGDKTLMVIPGNDIRPPVMMIVPRNDVPLNAGDDIRKKVIFYGDYADVIKKL